MSNNPRFIIHRFQYDKHLSPLALFGNEDEIVDSTQRADAEKNLRQQMSSPGHNPEQDRWVVTIPDHPERLIAHAQFHTQTHERGYGFIDVSPAWQRQGIGSALLECLRERAREQGVNQLILNASLDNAAGHAFLRHHGLPVVGHIRHLNAPAGIDIPQPQWPPGFTVRTFAEVQDFDLLAAVQIRCYHDMWGHTENTPGVQSGARIKQSTEEYPGYLVPEGVFLLFAPDGEAVGVCYSRFGDETSGERSKSVDSPGVAPAYRHLGLQRPLTLIAMQWLRQHGGSGAIELETYGDFDEAIAIYQALGFVLEPANHWVDYRLSILDREQQ